MDGRGSGRHVMTSAIGHAHYPRALKSCGDAARRVHAVLRLESLVVSKRPLTTVHSKLCFVYGAGGKIVRAKLA